jgi:hypothetical protein
MPGMSCRRKAKQKIKQLIRRRQYRAPPVLPAIRVAAAALVAGALSVLAVVGAVAVGTDLTALALTSLMPAFGLRHFDLLSPLDLHKPSRLARFVRLNSLGT